MLSGENFLDWLVGITIAVVILVLSYSSCRDGWVREETCKKEHHGEPYFIENDIATKTANGCKVIRLTRFTKECLYLNEVYVTECPDAGTFSTGR